MRQHQLETDGIVIPRLTRMMIKPDKTITTTIHHKVLPVAPRVLSPHPIFSATPTDTLTTADRGEAVREALNSVEARTCVSWIKRRRS